MDRTTQYRCLIQQLFKGSRYFLHGSSQAGVETFTIFDEAGDHYLLMDMGWAGKKRVQRTLLHVRLKNEKIWIEEDWTEEGIATEMLAAGVPKEDIVLAFHHPAMRDRKSVV